MKILIAHNAYQHRGGEDVVVDREIALLRAHGHEVEFYQRHNDELETMSRPLAAVSTIWSQQSVGELDLLCNTFQPDVIHVHNTLPLISPSLYWIAARRNVPVVQTLHNFRLLCPQAMLLREGKVCEDCIGKIPWRAVTRKCYRESAIQSAVLSGMLVAHRVIGTYRERVTRYIALNTFSRDKFVDSGLSAKLFRIKPNFVESDTVPDWENRTGGIFIGRLSFEKGLDVLIDAVRKLNGASIRVVGTGPLEGVVQQAFRGSYLGFKPPEQVFKLLRTARFLVAPSTCYETFPLVAVEAFACGTPILASRHGGLGELVTDGVTGLLFNPADATDLAAKIAWAESHPEQMLEMGRAARAEYEAKYTPERNYRILMDIYEEAIAVVHGVRDAA
jgi:glycosyltransferase involved in cell wall biosynthesis